MEMVAAIASFAAAVANMVAVVILAKKIKEWRE
jgi:hypothetical protein